MSTEYYYGNESTVEKAFSIQSIINRIIKPFLLRQVNKNLQQKVVKSIVKHNCY